MRLMLKFTIPVKKGNQAAKDGSMGRAIDALMERARPEAAYFSVEQGKRAGFIVFEETDQANLPHLNEPLFQALDASVDISPVLTLEDLGRGLAGEEG